MRLRQLRYFLGVADAGSFTHAARTLRIAQPALSNQVKTLEEELGVSLLLRHSRGITLTPAGKFLQERAQNIIDLVDSTRASLLSFDSSRQISIKMGLPTTITGILAVPLIEAMREKYPNLTVHIIEGMTGHLQNWLQQEELGVAILFEVPETGYYSVRHIGYEQLVVIGPEREVISSRTSLDLSDLADLPIVHSTRAHQLRRILDGMAKSINRSFRYVAEIDSLPQIKLMVCKGRGYTVLPRCYVDREWMGSDLRFWELDVSQAPDEIVHNTGINLVASREFMQNDFAEDLLTEMERTIRYLIDTGGWIGATLERDLRTLPVTS